MKNCSALKPWVGVFLFLALISSGAIAAVYQNPAHSFHFDYDDVAWELVANGSSTRPLEAVDKTMNERTLVTVQRRVADDKYRARFSVVLDPIEKFGKTDTERLIAYQKHAVDFMKGQRFHVIEVKKVELPKLKFPAFEILANQRDFGLYFRQVAVLVGNEAYLLTAAARTAKFPDYTKEINRFFDTFAMNSAAPKTQP